MTNERLMVIAYNAICGLEEKAGYPKEDVLEYCCITEEEYDEIMT